MNKKKHNGVKEICQSPEKREQQPEQKLTIEDISAAEQTIEYVEVDQTFQLPEQHEEQPKQELTGEHEHSGAISAIPGNNENESQKKKATYEKLPKPSIRFSDTRHLPNFDTKKGHRCKLEGCGQQTVVFCETCRVHLCFVTGQSGRSRNCFRKFHILEEN